MEISEILEDVDFGAHVPEISPSIPFGCVYCRVCWKLLYSLYIPNGGTTSIISESCVPLVDDYSYI
jgi:hypothetical protein